MKDDGDDAQGEDHGKGFLPGCHFRAMGHIQPSCEYAFEPIRSQECEESGDHERCDKREKGYAEAWGR